MARSCPHCHRTLQGTRGVMRHVKFCNGREEIPRWRYNHNTQDQRSDIVSSQDYRHWSAQSGFVGQDAETLGFPYNWDQTAGDEDIVVGTNSDMDFGRHSVSRSAVEKIYHSSRMTMSSGAATIIDTYFEVEGGPVPPGHGYTDESTPSPSYPTPSAPLLQPLPVQPLDQLQTRWFFPFRNLAEYELCLWLFRTKTTASNMKEFFDIHIEPWKQLTDIKSVSTWKRTLHRIPYGIPDDDILESTISIADPETGQQLNYVVRFRSILSIIRFLIGHIPFKPNLAYAPVRLFKDEERTIPIWNEMHTGSWWWDQQKSLPPGSTLVPVLIASDKTQLTQHHGDKTSHPIYATIGNLDKRTRRSQKRPSKVLLGFLPTVGKSDHRVVRYQSYELKRYIFNTAMGIVTQELQRPEIEGIRLRCADGVTRHCFPVIGGFMLDYEEQALVTGVKSGQHCVICRVPPQQRENLTPLEQYPLRTHQYTQECIRSKRGRKRKRDADDQNGGNMDVADVISFMWSFRRVNMHEIMHVDILHQCFKGVVHRAVTDWVYSTLKKVYGETQTDTLLDGRFRAIPRFPGLKKFQSFSAISQWTGVEQKAMLRQLVPALAPLVSVEMIQFLRAMVDFTLHAQYYSHDGETITWMEKAIDRMDAFKEIFRGVTAPGAGFNIPKLHAITHYPMMIRKFGTADGYDTAIFEAGHKYIVKEWYQLTNKRETFEEQILEHNQRAHNMLAMQDLLEFRIQETLLLSSKEVPAQVTAATKPRDLDALQWDMSGVAEKKAIKRWMKRIPPRRSCPHLRRGTSFWRQASTIAQFIDLPSFLDALAVFVREERLRHSGLTSHYVTINKKEVDSSWINRYPICVHPSISCWKAVRDDGSNADTREREFVRCDPHWHGRRQWRRDSVWIQEYLVGEGDRRPLQGRLPSRLLIVISILDIEATGEGDIVPVYTGAFLDVYTLRDQGKQNSKHGMIEAQRHSPGSQSLSRALGHQRFYHLSLILRSAHLVPASEAEGNLFYINPYVDWDQYATVFDCDFLEKDEEILRRLSRRNGWQKRPRGM